MLRDYLRHVAGFSPAARLYLLGHFLGGIGQGSFWVLRNLYLKEAGLAEGAIGNLLSVTQFGTLLVAVPLAFFIDRGRIRGWLALGTACFGAALAGIALWPTPGPLVLWSLLAGMGQAMLGAGTAPFYMRHSRPTERAYLFGVGTALGPGAGLVGTGAVWILARIWGEGMPAQKQMLLLSGAVSVATAAVYLAIRENPPGPREAGRRLLDWGRASRICIPGAVIGLGAGLTIPFINLYFSRRFGYGPSEVSAVFSVAQAVVFLAFLAAPVLARRYGGARTIVACQLLSIPFFLAMAFAGTPWLAVAGFLGRHALMNMANPVMANFTMEVMPEDQRALTHAFRDISWGAAWLAGTSSGGWIIERLPVGRDGFTTAMLATIVLYVAGSLMYWISWKDSPAMPPQPGDAEK